MCKKFVYIFILIFFVNSYPMYVKAEGYSASDVLGQSVAGVPIFSTNYENNHQYDGLTGLANPKGVAVDSNHHRLFVSDSGNNRVVVYNLDSNNNLVDYIADYVLGQRDMYGQNSGIKVNRMANPKGLAYDSTGDRLFVVDTNNYRVLVFDTTTITTGEDAVNVIGQVNFISNSDAGCDGHASAHAMCPEEIYYESVSKMLYVSDRGNNRVLVFDVNTITNNEDAVDVIGQIRNGAVNFTSNGSNNYYYDTLTGFNNVSTTLIDYVHHRMFVSDKNSNRILVYNLDSNDQFINKTPDYVLGQVNFEDTSDYLSVSKLSSPQGLAYDPDDDLLFVSDSGHNRVLVFDVATITDGEDAVHVLGQPNFDSADDIASQSRISSVVGVAFDAIHKNLFVSDYAAHRVLVYDTTSITNGENAIHVLGQPDFTSNTCAGWTAAIICHPRDVVYDPIHNRLFVGSGSGSTNRILVFDVATITDGEDAVHVLGQVDLITPDSCTNNASTFCNPLGMSYDSVHNLLYLTDTNHHRILVFDVATITDGEDAVHVLGQPDFISQNTDTTINNFNYPRAVFIDTNNNRLYVSDTENNRILVFDVSTIVDGEDAIDVVGQYTNGVENYNIGSSYSGYSDILHGLSNPYGLVIDQSGHRLFITDPGNRRVLQYDLDSNNLLIDHTPDHVLGQTDLISSNSGTDINTFQYPHSLTFDTTNNRLFVGEEYDSGNNRIMVFDVTNITNGENAIHVLGQPDFTSNNSTNTSANNFDNGVRGLSYNNTNGYLYSADDGNNRILIFDTSTIINNEDAIDVIGQNKDGVPNFTTYQSYNYQENVNSSGFAGPNHIVIDTTHHKMFVSEQRRILVFNLDSDNVPIDNTADYVLGQSDFNTNQENNVNAKSFSNIYGLDIDEAKSLLYVSDNGFSRILVFDVSTIINNEDAVNVLGQPDFVSYNQNLSQSGLSTPQEISLDVLNQLLFVADYNNNRVMVFDVTNITNGENAVHVLGQPDFISNTELGTTQKSLFRPQGLTYGKSDTNLLFVSDNWGRVMIFNTSTINDYEDASWLIGQFDFTSGVSNVSRTSISTGDTSLSYDYEKGRLFVSESGYNRLMVFSFTGTSLQPADQVIGQEDFTSQNCNHFISAPNQDGLCYPKGSFYDVSHKKLYVADYNNSRVMSYDFHPDTNDNALPSVTNNGSSVIALDKVHHRLFVSKPVSGSDYTIYRVLVYSLDSNNLLLDAVPDAVLGMSDFTDSALERTTVTASNFGSVVSMVYDSINDRLFLSELGSLLGDSFARILVFDTSTITNGENAINVLGQDNLTAHLAPSVTVNTIGSSVRGMAYDGTNQRLFVTDYDVNRVLVFNVASITDGEDAVNVLGQNNFTASSFSSISINTLQGPHAIEYDPVNNRLFVGDNSPRLMVFDVTSITNGENAVSVLGQADFVTGGGHSYEAMAISSGDDYFSYDSGNGYLYDIQPLNNRVARFDVNTIVNGEDALVVYGQANFTTNVRGHSMSQFDGPTQGIYDSTSHNMYVVDTGNDRILVFNVDTYQYSESNYPASTSVIGQSFEGSPTFKTNDSYDSNHPDKKHGFSNPKSATLDTVHHRLFVSDGSNNRVVVYNLNDDNTPVDYAVDYVLGQEDILSTSCSGYSIHAKANTLCDPSGLVYDGVNNLLYVSDSEGNRVLVYDVSTILTGEDAINVLGQGDFTSSLCNRDSTASINTLCFPYGLALDSTNNILYVSDSNNNRILSFNVSSITNGEDAINVLGQGDFTSSLCNRDSTASINTLCSPIDLAFDSVHNKLYISENSNNRVVSYDVSSILNGQNAEHVFGQSDFVSISCHRGESTTKNTLCEPHGITLDETKGVLYVSDSDDDRIIFYDINSITDGEDAIAVIGQNTFYTDSSFVDIDTFSYPRGVTNDSIYNRILVSDSNNNRVMIFTFLTLSGGTPPNGTTGTSYTHSFSSSGSRGTVSYSIVSGSIPPGLRLSSSTGVLSGNPTTAGTYTFTVRANDTYNNQGVFYSTPATHTITIASGNFGPSGGYGNNVLLLNTKNTNNSNKDKETTFQNKNIKISKLITKNLKPSIRDNEVILLQKFLNSHGFIIVKSGVGSPNKETNYFGVRTKQALIQFQKNNKDINGNPLKADGKLGPLTRGIINKIISSGK